MENGGKIWLHGFNSGNIQSVAELFPFKPHLAAYDATIQSAARRSDDPLMVGLSSMEFYWTRYDMSTRGDLYIEPALLVKVPSGSGTLLFDNLLWENAFNVETTRVSRLVTTLARNLGSDIQVAEEKSYRYTQADISKQANMGFYDEVASDGKGGWTDQGTNDMRYFLINHSGLGVGGAMEVGVETFPATATFAGRPFRLVDPKKNDGKSVIALRGQNNGPTLPTEAKGIAFGAKANKLWFLQTACWANNDSNKSEVAHYIIHYADGTQQMASIRYGLEVSDWWDPRPLSFAKVGWSGRNDVHSPVGLYVSEWTNPQPTKVIQSIDLVGNLSPTQLLCVGITGGIEINTETAFKPIADWEFGEAKNGAVVSAIGTSSLAFGNLSPVTTENGLRFSNGQSLAINTSRISGLGTGPVELEVTLTPEAIPTGALGGIYQASAVGQNGFRVLLNQAMKISVEAFPGDGKGRFLTSKTVLETGKTYKVNVKFDGVQGCLFINDKLETFTAMPAPAPFSGEVSIGKASGKDYNFNGVISRVILKATGE